MPVIDHPVHRSTVDLLRKLFTRARKKWGQRFDHEPDWKDRQSVLRFACAACPSTPPLR